MLETLFTAVIGIIGGFAVGVQTPIMGVMSGRIGGASGSLIVHLSGTVASALLVWARGGENLGNWRQLPWYVAISGVFGLVLYLTLSHTFPRVGGVASVMLIIVGQLVMGMLVDHFGWLGAPVRSVDATRLLAVGLMLLASYLMVR
jgi:transporter family-2 protein